MIIPIMNRDIISERAFIICVDTLVGEEDFLRRGKVKPGTYAGDLLAKLHHAIFHRSLELKYDYSKYYRVEYSTVDEYLQKRFLLPSEIIREVCAQFLTSTAIFILHPPYYFLEGEYGQTFLEKLLEQGGTL